MSISRLLLITASQAGIWLVTIEAVFQSCVGGLEQHRIAKYYLHGRIPFVSERLLAGSRRNRLEGER
jgi:hypothetical protein